MDIHVTHAVLWESCWKSRVGLFANHSFLHSSWMLYEAYLVAISTENYSVFWSTTYFSWDLQVFFPMCILFLTNVISSNLPWYGNLTTKDVISVLHVLEFFKACWEAKPYDWEMKVLWLQLTYYIQSSTYDAVLAESPNVILTIDRSGVGVMSDMIWMRVDPKHALHTPNSARQ